MIIYVDELFVKNLIMTYLILFLIKRILNIKTKISRLFFTSIISSLLSIFLIIYDLNNIVTKILSLALLCYIAYIPKSIFEIAREMVGTIIITFLLGGILKSSINKFIEILILIIIGYYGIKKYDENYKSKKWKARNIYKIKMKLENKIILLDAFLDTGNMVSETFSGQPVIFISRSGIENKISKNIISALQNADFERIDFNILKNIRPILYSTVSECQEIMYGLKVENIEINTEKNKIVSDAIIVITNKKINCADALIGINLLEGGYKNGFADNTKTEDNEIIC